MGLERIERVLDRPGRRVQVGEIGVLIRFRRSKDPGEVRGPVQAVGEVALFGIRRCREGRLDAERLGHSCHAELTAILRQPIAEAVDGGRRVRATLAGREDERIRWSRSIGPEEGVEIFGVRIVGENGWGQRIDGARNVRVALAGCRDRRATWTGRLVAARHAVLATRRRDRCDRGRRHRLATVGVTVRVLVNRGATRRVGKPVRTLERALANFDTVVGGRISTGLHHGGKLRRGQNGRPLLQNGGTFHLQPIGPEPVHDVSSGIGRRTGYRSGRR